MTVSFPTQCSIRSLVSECGRFLGRDSAFEPWPLERKEVLVEPGDQRASSLHLWVFIFSTSLRKVARAKEMVTFGGGVFGL